MKRKYTTKEMRNEMDRQRDRQRDRQTGYSSDAHYDTKAILVISSDYDSGDTKNPNSIDTPEVQVKKKKNTCDERVNEPNLPKLPIYPLPVAPMSTCLAQGQADVCRPQSRITSAEHVMKFRNHVTVAMSRRDAINQTKGRKGTGNARQRR